MPLDRAREPDEGQPELLRLDAPHHQKAFRAGARHDAIEQAKRIGDQPGVQIVVDVSGFLKRHAGSQRIVPLRDAELAEVLRWRRTSHVVGGQEGEARIRSARPYGKTASCANTLKLAVLRRKLST